MTFLTWRNWCASNICFNKNIIIKGCKRRIWRKQLSKGWQCGVWILKIDITKQNKILVKHRKDRPMYQEPGPKLEKVSSIHDQPICLIYKDGTTRMGNRLWYMLIFCCRAFWKSYKQGLYIINIMHNFYVASAKQNDLYESLCVASVYPSVYLFTYSYVNAV